MAELSTVEKVFDLGTPVFSRDFIVVDLIPSAVFASSITAVLIAGAPGHPPNGRDLTSSLGDATMMSWATLLAVSMVLAIAMNPLRLRIRRLLTGVWNGRWTVRLANRLRERSKDRFDEANEAIKVSDPTANGPDLQARGDDYKRRFPDWPFVAPTQLGNAYEALRKLAPESEEVGVLLGHAEPKAYRATYAKAREQADPIVHLVDDARLKVAAAERNTVLWTATAAIYAWLLSPHGWWVTLAFGAITIARLSYLAAVDNVVEFNYLIEQLFERFKVALRV